MNNSWCKWHAIGCPFKRYNNPADAGRKLNAHKTSSECLMYIQFTSCVYGDIRFFSILQRFDKNLKVLYKCFIILWLKHDSGKKNGNEDVKTSYSKYHNVPGPLGLWFLLIR